MKQLIDSSGPHVVVALHRRAYALVVVAAHHHHHHHRQATTSPSSSSSTAAVTKTIGDGGGDGSSSPTAEPTSPVGTAVELLPAPSGTGGRLTNDGAPHPGGEDGAGETEKEKKLGTTTNGGGDGGVEGTEEGDDGEGGEDSSAAAAKGGDGAVGGEGAGSAGGGTEVRAVACHRTRDGVLLCAVARSDKTLSVYSVRIPRVGDDASALTVRDGAKGKGDSVEPSLVHACEKRVSALRFAPLSRSSPSPIVVVAADLAGDATAFPVVEDYEDASEERSEHGGEKTRGGGGKCTPGRGHRRRLFLGHTGSMLTGIKIVPSPSSPSTGTGMSMRILTSDRDEKIRVSSFPDSYRVCGYLLGHGAFVSSLDVAVDVESGDSAVDAGGDDVMAADVRTSAPCARNLCITCGGDGTVRLWDYDSCRQLDVFDYRTATGTVDGDEDGGREREGDGGGDATGDGTEAAAAVGETAVESTNDTNEHAGGDGDGRLGGAAAAIPTNVALRRDGRVAVVLRNGIPALDLLEVSSEMRPPPAGDCELRLERVGSIPCRTTAAAAAALPLCATFLSEGTLLVVVKASDGNPPTYLLQFDVVGGGAGATDESPPSLVNVSDSSPLCRALRDTLCTSPQVPKIDMPSSIVELDGAGQFKLIKAHSVVEKTTTWNDASKMERSRVKRSRRGKRRKKRRRVLEGGGGGGGSDNGEGDEEVGSGGAGDDEGDDGSEQ